MEISLTPLQARVLRVLAGLPWTLTGGGALIGYHLHHRTTRDLDLFFRGRRSLDQLPAQVELRLVRDGLTVERLQTVETFVRLRVSDGVETFPIDLVAEPVPSIEPPLEIDGIYVDTAYEILVNKLNALLGRWATRDLVDVRALLATGLDLRRAMADAPKKDGGFSPETLAWVLDNLPESGMPEDLQAFRKEFVALLLAP